MSSIFPGFRFSPITLPDARRPLYLMSCPGVRFTDAGPVTTADLLAQDLARLVRQEVRLVLSCLTAPELSLGQRAYATAYRRQGIDWLMVPIPDMTAPTPDLDIALDEALAAVGRVLRDAGVAIHCMAGLGRTGTIAARFAMDRGLPASQAITLIRQQHDRGAIETRAQEDYLNARALRRTGNQAD